MPRPSTVKYDMSLHLFPKRLLKLFSLYFSSHLLTCPGKQIIIVDLGNAASLTNASFLILINICFSHWHWSDNFYFAILTFLCILGFNSIWSVALFFSIPLHYTKYFISGLPLYFYVKECIVLFYYAVLVTFWYQAYVNIKKPAVTIFIFFPAIHNSLNSIRIMCSFKVWKNLPIKHLGTAPFMDVTLGDWFLFLPWIVVYFDCQIW